MRDRPANAVAGWVWATTGLLPVAAAVGAVALFESATRAKALSSGALEWWILGAGVIIVLSGVIDVPSFTSNPLTPAFIAVASLPFLTVSPGERVFDFQGAMAAVLGAMAALWAIRAVMGHDPRKVTGRFVRRSAAFASYLFLFDAFRASSILGGSEWRALAAFALAAAAAFAVEVILDSFITRRLFMRRVKHALPSAAADAAVFVSLMATGALFGLAYEAIGPWAVAVAVLPYGFAAGAFRRLAETKRTYEQTLVALAQIPEVGGHTEPGHAARTNELSLAVADRIGVSSGEWERINYASYLHDIGRITLNEPSILRQGFTEVDIAHWGAEIVGETSYLEDVADVVRRQHEPFRSPGEQYNPDLPLAARIIKVCSAYDEAVSERGLSPLDAIEQIYKGTTYDYDPEIVNTLRGVLERRGAFNHPSRLDAAR